MDFSLEGFSSKPPMAPRGSAPSTEATEAGCWDVALLALLVLIKFKNMYPLFSNVHIERLKDIESVAVFK